MSNSANGIATVTEVADDTNNGWKTYEVRLEDFMGLLSLSEKDKSVVSPEFTCYGHRWYLDFRYPGLNFRYPGGALESDDGMVGILLATKSRKTIKFQYEISVKDEKFSSISDFSQCSPWGYDWDRSQVIDALVNGALIVTIRMKLPFGASSVSDVSNANDNGWKWKMFEARYNNFAKQDHEIFSPEFSCFGRRWRLAVCPGNDTESSNNGMVSAWLVNMSLERITVQYEVLTSIGDDGGIDVLHAKDQAEIVHHWIRSSHGKHMQGMQTKLCPRSDLINNLVGGTLIIKVRMKQAESWQDIWKRMRNEGWKQVPGTELINYYYIHPSVAKMKKRDILRECIEGVHYFTSYASVLRYAQQHLGWAGTIPHYMETPTCLSKTRQSHILLGQGGNIGVSKSSMTAEKTKKIPAQSFTTKEKKECKQKENEKEDSRNNTTSSPQKRVPPADNVHDRQEPLKKIKNSQTNANETT